MRDLHVVLNIDYSGLDGFLRALSKIVSFSVPVYSTITKEFGNLVEQLVENIGAAEGKSCKQMEMSIRLIR